MPYVRLPVASRGDIEAAAELRWAALEAAKPELGPAVALQRRLIALVIDLKQTIEHGPFPRLSLPGKYVQAKLVRGVPALAGEPLPLPVPLLRSTLLKLCHELALGGGRAPAEHIAAEIESGALDAGSLLAASLSRNQIAVRGDATRRGLAPDLVWLVSELTVGPLAHRLLNAVFAAGHATGIGSSALIGEALDAWEHGYCPACGSWPAMAEVVDGHRTLRCSFCAAGWELSTYACIYCQESADGFVTAAPDEERKDRRVEVCSGCGAYLKTIDATELSPFPLLAIGDLETMDLDVAAMDHGYTRPAMKDFRVRL
jgi:FdhE protein